MKRSVPIWLVVLLALVIVGVTGYLALIRPKRAEVGRLDGEVARLETELEAAKQLAAAQEKGSAKSTIRVADLVRLAKAMPDQTDMAGIVLELNEAATSAGVEFTAIQPGTPSLGNGYTAIPITLTFQGSYYDLTQLLFRIRSLVTVRDGVLDASGRLFTIDSLNLQEGTDGFPQVQAVLIVSAYQYGVDASVLGAAAAAASASTSTSTTTTTTTTGETPTATVPAPPATTAPAPPAEPSAGQQAQGVTP